MVHVRFDPDTVDWNLFFANQQGGSLYFQGLPYQRGYGIGSLFASLYRYLLPIGKEVGKAIGKEGLQTTARVLSNVVEGVNPKNAIQVETKEGLRKLLKQGSEKLQKGQGRKKTIKAKKPTKKTKTYTRLAGKTVVKSKTPFFTSAKDYLNF